jgi:hypothetical protein
LLVTMKYLVSLVFITLGHSQMISEHASVITFTRKELLNKIMGGWAGQTIGVTFGGPTEFRFNGIMIEENEKIPWYDGYMRETFEKNPGLYDDLYMDLTFVEVFEKEGLNAPAKSFARAYAESGYTLWHANQAARYNLLNGIDPPASGHWLNNPHADDIDFQIEADFAGLMCPGMPQAASEICDKIGHIMNYGDGYYGGLYIANLYSNAYTTTNIERIIKEAIRSVPKRSAFHQCIQDVLRWHSQYPSDWKQTWHALQRKWADDIGCPDGVYNDFDIDAKLNAAYVTLGLLYGQGDFTRTLEIATRAGQDSDCNPSSAGGILGVMLGYENIPDYWKQGLKEIESMDFKYTTMSLEDAYDATFRHALQVIELHQGKLRNDNIIIRTQKPVEAKLEKSFEGHYPVEKRSLGNTIIEKELEFEFEGIGFVLRGETVALNNADNYLFEAELYLNNKYIEKVKLPTDFIRRKSELFWKYQLPHDKYKVKLRLLNPSAKHKVTATDVVVYDVNTVN